MARTVLTLADVGLGNDVFAQPVVEEPLRFAIGRRPNRHPTFGDGGPHDRLGAHLAKLEVHVIFDELLPRLGDMELAGPVRRGTTFTNALKATPVRAIPV